MPNRANQSTGINNPGQQQPVILVFAGHDPSGGAGIQADIETIASLNGHCTPIITALTVQNTCAASSFEVVSNRLLRQQTAAVLTDFQIAAVKIGMLGSAANANTVAELLAPYPEIPIILDPVLAAGGGGSLATADLVTALQERLIPRTYLLTPNSLEARALCPGAKSLPACAEQLLTMGAKHLLITGGHEDTDALHIVHRLWSHPYSQANPTKRFTSARLDGEYHGSGCTLAAACACFIGHGLEITEAINQALVFTHNSLVSAKNPGKGQLIPLRASAWQQNMADE